MHIVRNFIRIWLMIAGFGLMDGITNKSEASVVYELSGGNGIRQQTGNNQYYYGDDVTLSTAGPQRLDSVTLKFTLYADPGIQYTPDLSLTIFEIDTTSRKPDPNKPSLGTAIRNNVSFSGSNSDAGAIALAQSITFDFASQGIILPTNFAFVYRDNNSATILGSGFSVVIQDPSTASVGSTVNGFLSATPNDPNNFEFNFANGLAQAVTGNLVATIQATAVPEPSMLAMGLTIAMFGVGFASQHRKAANA